MSQSERQNSAGSDSTTEEEVDRIVAAGPAGTFAVAGVATAIVVATVLLFYIFVYVPRGVVQ